MQWVYFLHSGSLLKWLHPADGNTSKSPMTSSNVSKRLLEIHLTVGWKLVKWPMSRWFHRRLASVSPSPRLLRANERLLFLFFFIYPLPPRLSCSFLSFDNPIYSDLLLSRGNEPLFPTFPTLLYLPLTRCRHLLFSSPPYRLSFPRPPSPVFRLLLSAEAQFPASLWPGANSLS